jgi:protein-tyrosine sulfotransferase
MPHAPIFILGSHKSGTSLLRSLLDGHPELFVIPFETHFMALLGRWITYSYRKQAPVEDANFLEGLVEILESYARSVDRQADVVLGDRLDMDAVRAFVGEMDEADDPIQALTILKELLPQVVDGLETALGKRAVEKSVEHLEVAVELAQAFPKAQFIHIVRNPYANMVALRKFKAKDQGYPLINKVFKSLESGYYWLQTNQKLIPNYKVIRYEDLAQQPEVEMQSIAEFLQISFDSSLLEPTLMGDPWGGNSAYGKFKAISSEHLNRWKEEITPLEANLVTQHFGHVLSEHGYEKMPLFARTWKRAKGERLKRYFYNRFYPLYLK